MTNYRQRLSQNDMEQNRQTIVYVDPDTLTELNHTAQALSCPGKSFPVKEGIPIFVSEYKDIGQQKVSRSFAYKWKREDRWHDKEVFEKITKPLGMEFLGLKDDEDIKYWFGDKIVLDAGVGSGLSSCIYGPYARELYGVDISESVFVANKYLSHIKKLFLAQADIFALPYPRESFEVIVSNGVLHHTPDTKKALEALVSKLKVNGVILFYVYRKKAPIREFADDFIREKISDLDPEEAWEKLKPLTMLAKQMSMLNAKVRVEEDIDLLEIPAGEHDVQRLIYWYFLKFYWRDDLDFDANNHVNFDWYHPKYAHRHSKEEILGWLKEMSLKPKRITATQSGFGVIAQK